MSTILEVTYWLKLDDIKHTFEFQEDIVYYDLKEKQLIEFYAGKS
jgi:hypothetical protein